MSPMFTANPRFAVIIALQGEPCTGKTTLANSLADCLQCLVIRFDEILDVISSHEPAQPPTPKRAETLMSNAFDIITQMAKTHISFGNSVIIDSPLSRLSHLNKLVNLVLQPPKYPGHLRLILLQCNPKTEYAWQMRFEEHDFSLYQNKWYKPKDNTWPMKPVFRRDYSDNDIHPIVSKLVVDTTDHVPFLSMSDAITHLIMEPTGCSFELEEQIHSRGPSGVCLGRKQDPCLDLANPCLMRHEMHYWEEGINYDAICQVCDSKIDDSSGAAYVCHACAFTIHKACAEIENMEFPEFHIRDGSNCFPEEHLCTFCKEEGKEFSYECLTCLLKSYLKCKLVPAAMSHPGHPHRLCFRLERCYEYLCSACKRPGETVGYHCLENCNVECHPECALLPTVFKDHEHGGYKHDLEMVFCRDEKEEDYICDMCLEKTNPKAWYYYCHECHLPLHLDCAFKDFDA